MRNLLPRTAIKPPRQIFNVILRDRPRAQLIVRVLARSQKRLAWAIAVGRRVGAGTGGGAVTVFVFDSCGNLGQGVWGDVDGRGVDEGDGELDFEVFGRKGGCELDIEEIADTEEAAWGAVRCVS